MASRLTVEPLIALSISSVSEIRDVASDGVRDGALDVGGAVVSSMSVGRPSELMRRERLAL